MKSKNEIEQYLKDAKESIKKDAMLFKKEKRMMDWKVNLLLILEIKSKYY